MAFATRFRVLPTLVLLALAATVLAGCGSEKGNVFSLEAGECFDDPDLSAEGISDVDKVDCAEPHDNEVFATFDLPGDDYPGDEQVRELAFTGCEERFADYVGIDYASSVLFIFPIFPTEETWNEVDDREVICGLFDGSGEKLEGSMEGAAR